MEDGLVPHAAKVRCVSTAIWAFTASATSETSHVKKRQVTASVVDICLLCVSSVNNYKLECPTPGLDRSSLSALL